MNRRGSEGELAGDTPRLGGRSEEIVQIDFGDERLRLDPSPGLLAANPAADAQPVGQEFLDLERGAADGAPIGVVIDEIERGVVASRGRYGFGCEGLVEETEVRQGESPVQRDLPARIGDLQHQGQLVQVLPVFSLDDGGDVD